MKKAKASAAEASSEQKAKSAGGKSALPSSDESDTRVFLPYLPESLTEDMLRSHFGRFGKIVDIFIPPVKSSKDKRIAFITFLTNGEAMSCARQPKHFINNKTCEVVKAAPKHGVGKPETAAAARGGGFGAQVKSKK